MSDLATLVPALKRAVAVPGTFEDVYTSTLDSDLIGSLMDGFAEAQLDGFFTPTYGGVQFALDTSTHLVTPDFAQAQGALIVIYSASRFIYTYLLNLKNRQRYAAKGADFDVEQSATILTALLKDMQGRKAYLIQQAALSGPATAFAMADGYFLAATQHYYFNGSAYDVGGGAGNAYSDVNPLGW